jgi:hypothetical protein
MSVQVTPLRQRMIDDMAIRNMSPLTQKAYVRAVKNFSLYFQRSPNALTFEDVRRRSCLSIASCLARPGGHDVCLYSL